VGVGLCVVVEVGPCVMVGVGPCVPEVGEAATMCVGVVINIPTLPPGSEGGDVKKWASATKVGTAKTRQASTCTAGPLRIASSPLLEVDPVVLVPKRLNEPADDEELAADEVPMADGTT